MLPRPEKSGTRVGARAETRRPTARRKERAERVEVLGTSLELSLDGVCKASDGAVGVGEWQR